MGCFPFARRYLGNHFCFLLLGLLRCFSSPRSPLQPMYSAADVQTLPWTGFPIRKSPDQSLFSSSPKLIAAYHVLHRLLAPRHPPPALTSLATNFSKEHAEHLVLSTSKLSKSDIQNTSMIAPALPTSADRNDNGRRWNRSRCIPFGSNGDERSITAAAVDGGCAAIALPQAPCLAPSRIWWR